MNRRSSSTMLALLLALPVAAQQDRFLADVAALAGLPHRLVGSEEARRAADYVRACLAETGVKQVFTLSLPTWQMGETACSLSIGDTSMALLPMRPDITIAPVTPPEGLTGPYLYAGTGELWEYGTRPVLNAVVGLEYDCQERWKRAFAMGARAVVFLGSGHEASGSPKHVGIPANLLRYYAPPELVAAMALRSDRPLVSIRSSSRWRKAAGSSIVAFIPGTEPDFSPRRSEPEMLVLSAALDTWGDVPLRSPGARGAANCAALLDAARCLVRNPVKRDVLLVFADGQAFYHQGMRMLYSALMAPHKEVEARAHGHVEEMAFRRQLLAALPATPGPVEGPGDVRAALMKEFESHAEYRRTDESHKLLRARVSLRSAHSYDTTLDQQLHEREALLRRIQTVRRLIGENRAELADSALYERIRAAAGARPGESVKRSVLLSAAQRMIQETSRELELDRARLERTALPDSSLTVYRDSIESLMQRWDSARRALADRRVEAIEPALYAELHRLVSAGIHDRMAELEELIQMDEEHRALRRALEDRWIVLHVTYNFSDGGTEWGVVPGDNSQDPFRSQSPSGDNPGYYSLVLRALRRAAEEVPGLAGLNHEMLVDPLRAQQHVPGAFVSGGVVAGTHGVFNLSLMTCDDARERDGQPSDNLASLRCENICEQARQAQRLLGAVADGEDISLKRVFADLSMRQMPKWASGKSSGYFAGLQVTGGLAEDRPASDAVLAVWQGAEWATPNAARAVPGFERFMLERVDGNGRYGVQGVRDDYYNNNRCVVLGVVFDSSGVARAVTTHQTLSTVWRVNLFPGSGYVVSYPVMGNTAQAGRLLVMEATSNASLRQDRMLSGMSEGFGFFYVHMLEAARRLKIFQQDGPVLLGQTSREQPYGEGFDLAEVANQPPVDLLTADNLWNLNEVRLSTLRARSVSDAPLELLHGRARRLIETAERTPEQATRVSMLAQSAALSRRVYGPVREIMDDLIKAVVILLLLTIPFAFALERLLLCAANIYARIAGFAAAFAATFVLLYLLHPGFSIAATPSMVFLAFVIILLASMVIYIMARKFRSELMAYQGRSSRFHNVEISRMGTLLVAMNMGMSTMRRRPIRTFLTTLTVLMLTFTILSFASFAGSLGVRSFYVGPVSENVPPTFLVKDVNYAALSRDVIDMLHARAGVNGRFTGIWWLTSSSQSDKAVGIAARGGEPVFLDGMLGVSAEELERWPAFAEVIGGSGEPVERLARDGVYLPAIVAQNMELTVGDTVMVNGRPTPYAGMFDAAALQRLRHLDDMSVVPVNFLDASYVKNDPNDQVRRLSSELVQRDFTRLSANQVAIASDEFVSRQGGKLYLISKYGEGGATVSEEGERLAEVTKLPVWSRTSDGVERKVATKVAAVSGGLGLLVPLILGRLIIFGTLLGSITDREREIYTFSALGLGPSHIGFLFVAEACVYAIVGGMGGQLLAQMFGVVASHLADKGLIEQPALNFSSANSLIAIGIVMLTVLVSAIYPAVKASKSANPGVQRSWRMPVPDGDELRMVFPFTVSAYDITGVVSFLAEHFGSHEDAGLGCFAARDVGVGRDDSDEHLQLSARVSLAPFDLGVSQDFRLTAVASEIAGVDEVIISAHRVSGTQSDWVRSNRVFIHELRKQFLLWRTLSAENIEYYRMQTLQALGSS